jgi:hypothetical protein
VGKVEKAEAVANEYKVKYEGIVQLYQKLRAEHLELLEKVDNQTYIEEYVREILLKKEIAEDRVREFEEQLKVLGDQVSFTGGGENSLQSELEKITDVVRGLIDDIAQIECSDASLVSVKGLSGELAEMIALLIKRATDLQHEIEQFGADPKDPESFYLRNSIWTKGLISAAQAVGSSAVTFSDTLNKALTENLDADYLAVSAGALSASVAQLVAASRVKAARDSKKLALLEEVALQVKRQNSDLCESIEEHSRQSTTTSFDQCSADASRVQEMELKVGIKKREREIEEMRAKIGSIHRAKYEYC